MNVFFVLVALKIVNTVSENTVLVSDHDYAAYTIYNQGVRHAANGQSHAAINSFEQALELKPEFFEALNNLGLQYVSIGKLQAAIHTYDVALKVAQHRQDKTQLTAIYSNIGYFHFKAATRGQSAAFEEAAANDPEAIELKSIYFYKQALRYTPDDTNTLYNLGNAYKILEQYPEAITQYRNVLDKIPSHFGSNLNIACILVDLERLDESVPYLRRAVLSASNDEVKATSLNNLGVVLRETGNLQEALDIHYAALTLNRSTAALGNILIVLRQLCLWDRFEQLYVGLLSNLCENGACNLPPYDSLLAPFPLVENAKTIARSQIARFRFKNVQPAKKSHYDKLRIGYLSFDMKKHVMGYLTLGLFEKHDRQHFELFVYSYCSPDETDTQRQLLKQAVDHFVDIPDKTPQEIAQLVKFHEIDILIDLMAHTRGGRIEIPATFPASTYINYLGYPGTSGFSTPGTYIMIDKIVGPPESVHSQFSENIIYLPETYQSNDYNTRQSFCPTFLGFKEFKNCRLRNADNKFQFVNFNKLDKFEPVSFRMWMNILKRVHKSVLLLLTPRTNADIIMKNVRSESIYAGVHPSRIIFVPTVTRNEHLDRIVRADLFLDNLYYGAHTTAADTLWAGVPVLTVQGGPFSSRVGSSLLKALHLDAVLVMHSVKEFEDAAVSLALNPALMFGLRGLIASRLLREPLFNTDRITRHIETAYQSTQHIDIQQHQSTIVVLPLVHTAPLIQRYRMDIQKCENSHQIVNVVLRFLSSRPTSYFAGVLWLALGSHLANWLYIKTGLMILEKENASITNVLVEFRFSEKDFIDLMGKLLVSPTRIIADLKLLNRAFFQVLFSMKDASIILQVLAAVLPHLLPSHISDIGQITTFLRLQDESLLTECLLIPFNSPVDTARMLHIGAILSAQSHVSSALSAFKSAVLVAHELRFQPSAVNIERTNSIRIAIYCDEYSQSWWPHWGPRSPESEGAGGSEEAVIFLARELVLLGFQVIVYGDPPAEDVGMSNDGVFWRPYTAYNVLDPPDVFIAWRYHISSVLGRNAKVKFLWLHDMLGAQEGEIYQLIQENTIDFVLTGSKFHSRAMGKSLANYTKVLGYGLLEKYFYDGDNDKYTGIYASSPIRGLQQLLDVWPSIYERIPEAKLKIYYGFSDSVLKWGRDQNIPQWEEWVSYMKNLIKSLEKMNVEYIGLVQHHEIAIAYSRAGFALYPTSFSETGCVSLMKALAMGAIPITSRYENSSIPDLTGEWDLGPSARNTLMSNDLQFQQEYADAVVHAMKMPDDQIQFHRKRMMHWSRKALLWNANAKRLEIIIGDVLKD